MFAGTTINDPAFNYTSWIAYETIRDATIASEIRLQLKARSLEDAILLYNGQDGAERQDFLLIAIRDRRLEFRYDSGSGQLQAAKCPIQNKIK